MAIKRSKVTINGEVYEFTAKEKQIVTVLRQAKRRDNWIGPTDIGKACGRDYEGASAWCGPTLKKLVNMGLVVRCDKTPFKGKYRLV